MIVYITVDEESWREETIARISSSPSFLFKKWEEREVEKEREHAATPVKLNHEVSRDSSQINKKYHEDNNNDFLNPLVSWLWLSLSSSFASSASLLILILNRESPVSVGSHPLLYNPLVVLLVERRRAATWCFISRKEKELLQHIISDYFHLF